MDIFYDQGAVSLVARKRRSVILLRGRALLERSRDTVLLLDDAGVSFHVLDVIRRCKLVGSFFVHSA